MNRRQKLGASVLLGSVVLLTGCVQEDRSYELGLCKEYAEDYYFIFDWGDMLEVSLGSYQGDSANGKIRGDWKGVTWVDQTPVNGTYECQVTDGEVILVDEDLTRYLD